MLISNLAGTETLFSNIISILVSLARRYTNVARQVTGAKLGDSKLVFYGLCYSVKMFKEISFAQ
jgi:hypothetical protein